MTPDFLPKVISDSAVAGMYKGSIPVSVAIGDNQASFLGSVRDMENSVLANVGTGSQITFAAKRAEIMPGLELRPCTDGYLLQVGSSLCGGRALALLEEFFRKTAEMVAQKKIESAYPGMDTHLERWLRENTGRCASYGKSIRSIYEILRYKRKSRRTRRYKKYRNAEFYSGKYGCGFS